MKDDDRAERQYRQHTSILAYWRGGFEYLRHAGEAKEAASLGLFALMSGLSEEYCRASWSVSLEYDLWRLREGEPVSGSLAEVTERQRMLLRLLSEECDGWWMYDSDDTDPDAPALLVTLEQWRDHIDRTWISPGGRRVKP